MSSLARRSLRTTAAAAGIAAIGVGFAGHALAAPEAPALPGTDAVEAPDLATAPDLLSELPTAPSEGSELPAPFAFEMPATAPTTDEESAADSAQEAEAQEAPAAPAAPAAPTLPGLDALAFPAMPLASSDIAPVVPGAPSTDGIANMDVGPADSNGGAPEVGQGNDEVGALSGMDAAKMLAEMAQLAGNNNIG